MVANPLDPTSSNKPSPTTEPSAEPSKVKESAKPEVTSSKDALPQETNTYKPAQSQNLETNQSQIIRQYVIVLPGTNIVIQDRRAESMERQGHQAHGDDMESHAQRQGHGTEHAGGRGRPVSHAGETLAGLTASKRSHDVATRAAQFGGKDRPLSAFEKTMVARFEGGKTQAKFSQDGEAHFLKKTATEWTGFFEKFLTRTIQKVVGWNDVNGFLFRGLLQEKGMPQKGVMISDVMTAMGTDKFARIPVQMNKAQQVMLLTPGATLPKDMMQEVVGKQLRYLAVNPQSDEGVAQFGRAASRGMFASQQVENRVAEQLGLVNAFRGVGPQAIEAQHAQTERAARERRRRGGMWSNLFGGSDDVSGEGSTFVPWWSWDREERSGFRRWFVAVFGSLIFIALIFLVMALIHALRT